MRLVFILLFFFPLSALIADDKPTMSLHGYMQQFEQIAFVDDADSVKLSSTFHNRLNFLAEWKEWTTRIEVRTRLMTGNQLLQPGFQPSGRTEAGLLHLNKDWVNKRGVAVNTHVERALLVYRKSHWEFSLGRQRVNWGMSSAWNPNDVFNSYNFLTIDDVERAGIDALRIHYDVRPFNSIELVVKQGDRMKDRVAALLSRGNHFGYDHQLFMGVDSIDLFAGGGWAGHIGKSGFAGEFTGYQPSRDTFHSRMLLHATVSLDRTFEHGWFISLSGYWNNHGVVKSVFSPLASFQQVSKKQLLPFRYTALMQISKQVNPRFAVRFGQLYTPTNNCWVSLPQMEYLISDNWSFDLAGQAFLGESGDVFRTQGNLFWIRVKGNF